MKNRKLLLSILFIFLALIAISIPSFAADLDEIQKYYVTVDPRSDGTLDMTYYLQWKVLDSTSEGPLEWVKIGIPNANVDTIKALSSNIDEIQYTSLGGDYVRIDFDRQYHAGEIIDFSFSIHQSYMYTLTSNACTYEFTPGWFSDIKVKDARVFWNKDKVVSATSTSKNSDGYYVWKDSLGKNEKMTTSVSYNKGAFKVSTSMQASNATKSSSNGYSDSSSEMGIIVFIFIMIIIVYVFSAITAIAGGGYRSHGGYGYGYGHRHHHHHHHHHSSCASSCACVSSCACACACAGGGRAGCSRKDFYGTKLKVSSLNKALS